jgi:hypothetical protein
MRRRAPDGLSLASMIALGVASLLLAVALWSALRIAPVTAAPASRADDALMLAGTAHGAQRGSAPAVVALASDPFSPDRRLVDDAEEELAPRDTAPPLATGPMRLLGTVVRDTTGFAICQLATDPPRVIHLGERLGEMILITLEQGRAVFRAPNGTRLELSLAKPGT